MPLIYRRKMEASQVAKKRILPAWMVERLAAPAKKLAEGRTKRRKKVWTRTETVYCMNEAELVDAALCILAEKCKDREMESTSSEDETQEPLRVVAGPRWNTGSRCDSTGSRNPAARPKTPDKLEASACSGKTKPVEDDDALKYVREIFFS